MRQRNENQNIVADIMMIQFCNNFINKLGLCFL